VQHNLGVIRSRLSLDETFLEEFPDLAGEDNSDLLELYRIEATPGFTDLDGDSYKETFEVVTSRNDKGGWYYIRESGEIYANLPNGAYTKDEAYEIWNEEDSNSISYDFTDIDDFSTSAAANIDGWSRLNYSTAITSNPYDEYSIETTATFTGTTSGYGIYIQSDEYSNGYIFQYDKAYNALIIRERKDYTSTSNGDEETYTTLAKTSSNSYMTDKWWADEHKVTITVTNSTSDDTKQNVEIKVDDIVITNNYEIPISDTDNYTGIRTWGAAKTTVDIDSVSITEL